MNELGPDGMPWNPKNYLPLVINVALTGTEPDPSTYPQLPVTPKQIAKAVTDCFEQGARVFHLHMRDFQGKPTQDINLFAEAVDEVKAECPEAIICVTTSARASASEADRFAPLGLSGPLRPDLASLSLGSFNFPRSVSYNPPHTIRELARAMKGQGITPELEVFEPGMVLMEKALRKEGLLTGIPIFNLLLGSLGSSPASVSGLQSFLALMPSNSFWSIAGIGRFQLPAINMGIAAGGNVRVGLEDAPESPDGRGWSNEDLVRYAVSVAEGLQRPIATPRQARELMGLVPKV